jgi:hypothetical protein
MIMATGFAAAGGAKEDSGKWLYSAARARTGGGL